MKLHIDIETRSACDLRKCGSWIYSKHPTTDVTCISWALDDEPVQGIYGEPTLDGVVPGELHAALSDPRVEVWAHNVAFERDHFTNVLTPRFGWPAVAPDRWRCSMSLCARWGLPQSLAGAAKALRLPTEKDEDGRKLMLKMCKPRRTKTAHLQWFEDPADMARLSQYCNIDVEVERLIAKKLPELEPEELAIWQWTEDLNTRGMMTDRDLIESIQEVVDWIDARDLGAFQDLTRGEIESPRQVAALLDWLADEGCELPDLRKATVTAALNDKKLSKKAKRALKSRQNLSRSSLAKFAALLQRGDPEDHRIRGHLQYAGAHTLRWAGRGAQLQNLPSRTKISKHEIRCAGRIFKTRDPEFVEAVVTNPREVASMSVRSALCSAPGKVLVAADFASIEARGLLWLADAEQLEILRDGRNLYIEMAQRIYGRPIDKHVDALEYMLGKTVVLAAGYGMGSPKFRNTCAGYGVKIDEKLSQKVVGNYREWIHAVPKLWKDVERAFFKALRYGRATCANGKVEVEYKTQVLRCRLPSGRVMVYWYPRLIDCETSWGEMRPQLHFMKQGKITYTYGGKLVENIVQAMCRDLLRDAALRIQKEMPEHKAVLSVHDEIIYEVDKDKADLDAVIDCMCVVPEWAKGMPIAAEGWVDTIFKKD